MAAAASPTSVNGVDVRRLRGAIEFALLMVRESRKTRPGLKYPSALDRYAKAARVPNGSLNAVRKVLDGDADFRERLGAVATPDLVDDVGRLWLQRPEGWETAIVAAANAADAADAEADLATRLKRAEKRKEAAERTAARHAAELAGRDQRIEELESQLRDERARALQTADELDKAVADLGAAKTEARHARDKMHAAEQKLERVLNERTDSTPSVPERPEVNEGGAEPGSEGSTAPIDSARSADPVDGVDRGSVAQLAIEVASLAQRLAELGGIEPTVASDRADSDANADASPSPRSHPRQRRRRLSMPGGVRSGSPEGVRFLLGSGAAILVDGYNVTKLAWPGLSLIAQRDRLIDGAEQFATRHRIDITVVFDGSDVVGAHGSRRRHVRVVYSAPDEIADDVIRAEVERLPFDRAVVVVTNDREVIDDVEAMGANVVSSANFIEALG